MCLKLFTVGGPTLLYIYLDKLVLSSCLIVNTTLFSSTLVTELEFAVDMWD